MAGTFSLNTGGIPTLLNVETTFDGGAYFDFNALKSGSTVVDANVSHQAALRSIKLTGTSVFTEV